MIKNEKKGVYGEQKMQVRWNSVLSNSFHISNGVRKGGVLNTYLFSLYMNSLSENLNRLRLGCYIGDNKLNHVFFADDICLLAPSLNGLQDLVDMCTAYAKAHKIFFKSNTLVGVLFKPKQFCVSASPTIFLASFPDNVKYLGVKLNVLLYDDDDIYRQIRTIYCTSNNFKIFFSQCSTLVKNVIFRPYCSQFYSSQFGCNYLKSLYHRIKIAYKDAFKMLHNFLSSSSARTFQVQHNIITLDALLRKSMYSFVNRCFHSGNSLIKSLFHSDVFFKSSL